MNSDHAIEAQQLRKSYTTTSHEQVEILHGVSLAVGRGEAVAVMGPSGSGKSTLLHCLTGLDRPSSGRVLLFGQDLCTTSETQLARMRRTRIGFVFQSYNLVPTLDVHDNVCLPSLLAGTPISEDAVAAVLADLGLSERMRTKPASLSGGEQQRVALARVLVHKPTLLCADEPTGALDRSTGSRVMDRIISLAHTAGRSALVVTHDATVAAACDRVLFLRDGLLERELLHPTAPVVASTLTELSALTCTPEADPCAA